MGLTIHYRGQFKKRASLPTFIEEVKDIATTLEWSHHVFETEFLTNADDNQPSGKLHGLVVNPPNCEPLHFTFLSNRRMASVLSLSVWDKAKDPTGRSLFHAFTKTQFAGPDVHIVIINLFRYLAARYFTRFKLYDEGGYWETGNEERLRANFHFLDRAIRVFGDRLEANKMKPGEKLEDFLLRIADATRRELG